MKFLIDEDFVVIAKGAKVTPKNDESVYDTEAEPSAIATMKEIAKANDIKVTGKKAIDIKAFLEAGLSKIKLAQVKTQSTSEEVKKIVQDGHENGDSENEILIAIVKSGVNFQKALKEFKNAKIALGLSISAEERSKKAKALMEDEEFEPESYNDVQEMVKTMTDKKEGIPNTNEKQALAQIKKYCNDNKITMPKKPKEAVIPFAIKAMAWVSLNVEAELDEFEEWLEENERPEKFVEVWSKKFAQFKKAYEKMEAELEEADEE